MPDTEQQKSLEEQNEEVLDLILMTMKPFEWYGRLLLGKTNYRYPAWNCTKAITNHTRPARRPRWLRPNKVIPQKVYSFHTPFSAQTDGKQWVLQSNSSYMSWRVAGAISSFFLLIFFFFGLVPFPNEGTLFFLTLAGITLLVCSTSIYKSRTGGEDTWVVFDRTTGNVCFWKKNQKNSLTVPFEQVSCYWTTRYTRGGNVSSLYLMPEVNLPNERHRLWEVHMGFPSQYEQAQFYWRVLTDFMDRTRPIPEVPGLIHQVRFVEKNGYTIEDLTKGGIEITEAEFNEVDEEVKNDVAALDARLERLLEPSKFSAERLIEFYENAPVYARTDVIRSVMSILTIWVSVLKGEDRVMDPSFKAYFTFSEYESEMDKLADFFFKVDEERRAAILS